jgi:hypothetical protein
MGVSDRSKVLLGLVIGVLFAGGMAFQGEVLPGIVGGVLAALLCFLVLRDVERQREARRREQR